MNEPHPLRYGPRRRVRRLCAGVCGVDGREDVIETLRDKITGEGHLSAFLNGINHTRPKRVSILDIPSFTMKSPHDIYAYSPPLIDDWPYMEWIDRGENAKFSAEWLFDRSDLEEAESDIVGIALDRRGYDFGNCLKSMYDIRWDTALIMCAPSITLTPQEIFGTTKLCVDWHLRLATIRMG